MDTAVRRAADYRIRCIEIEEEMSLPRGLIRNRCERLPG